MALQKTITETSPVDGQNKTASYWKIVALHLPYQRTRAWVVLHGFESAAARENGESECLVKAIAIDEPQFSQTFSVQNMDQPANNPIKIAYNYIKSIVDGDFENAVDV